MKPSRRTPRSGFTLIEALISATFLATLFMAVAQVSARAADAYDEGSAAHALSSKTHQCLERIARAIEFADASILAGQVSSNLGDSEVAFATPVRFQGAAVTWRSVRILAELEPDELDDGVDNNGNGLVDERRVVLVEDAGTASERRVVLARGVAELFAGEDANNLDDNGNGLTDETGLSFSAQGDTVFVRLTCQRRDEAGRLLTRSAETAVRIRNN